MSIADDQLKAWIRDPRPLVGIILANKYRSVIRQGVGLVTKVEWHVQPGQTGMIPTVRVWHGDKLFSEHLFHNLDGVLYVEGDAPEMPF